MKDFKKCGLTAHPKLLKETLSIIKKELDLPWINENLYTNIQIMIDGEIHVSKRGYVLGMANYLFTIIQIVLYSSLNYEFDYLVGNDDCITIVDTEYIDDFI